jgi:two-component system, NarL family, sensor kinase
MNNTGIMNGRDQLIYYLTIGVPALLAVIVIILIVTVINLRKKIKRLTELHDIQEATLLNDAITIEETEKIRFSRYLHNELIPEINAAKAEIDIIRNEETNAHNRTHYQKAISLLENLTDRIQTTAWHLPSRIMRKYGLNEAIRYFTSKISETKKVNASFHLVDSFTGISEEKDVILFRIFQELIINIMKHASPTMISVATDLKENELEFIVLNDGRGLTEQDVEMKLHKEEGPGLQNIRNRMKLLGGTIHFHYKNNEQKTIMLIPVE